LHHTTDQGSERDEVERGGFSPAPAGRDGISTDWSDSILRQAPLFAGLQANHLFEPLAPLNWSGLLPAFIRPLPERILSEDVRYLQAKGAFTLPTGRVQAALLRAYVEYVHPYMPLLDLHEFLDIVSAGDGLCGQVSLLLYQAVLFSATAYLSGDSLRELGFANRRAARRALFQRTRLLYDFDYESDRLVLVQSLLLMTYWYETPDDQKDTWHWMGVAISLAQTIGLHRDPANTGIPLGRQRLARRIWWSCFMRDRLIALGMRRPTRIKDEDFDVPMLTGRDFDIERLPAHNQILPQDCTIVRDMEQQQHAAALCVEMARLCVIISHLLKSQYSMLSRENLSPGDTTSSTMMLFPNKAVENGETITQIDAELKAWNDGLAPACRYEPVAGSNVTSGEAPILVQRSLLHLTYQTAISALHRPQFLQSSPLQLPAAQGQLQELARQRVREASSQVTAIAGELHKSHLDRFLPTTGVTVVLPAMIIHLLDMKSPSDLARDKAVVGFAKCLQVLETLREMYAAADFAVGFLQAALRKASIDVRALIAGRIAAQREQPRANPMPSADMDPRLLPISQPSTPPPETSQFFDAVPPAFADEDTPVGAQRDWRHARPLAEALTPSASDSSDAARLDFGGIASDDDFGWNTVGNKLDFDQWLDFPAEGVGSSNETFAGMLRDGMGAEDESSEMLDIAQLQMAT
jgi:hypothetical protein